MDICGWPLFVTLAIKKLQNFSTSSVVTYTKKMLPTTLVVTIAYLIVAVSASIYHCSIVCINIFLFPIGARTRYNIFGVFVIRTLINKDIANTHLLLCGKLLCSHHAVRLFDNWPRSLYNIIVHLVSFWANAVECFVICRAWHF